MMGNDYGFPQYEDEYAAGCLYDFLQTAPRRLAHMILEP